ncbi:MAG: transglycosylase SLT domain-containing protein [Bdellovibrionales bacterium]|nr:transglycosylase SLT domain-containing protein [Bdellovibrionales bacterium]
MLEPNVVKALIASESDFKVDPPRNLKATGIAQITPETLKALQDPAGEVKDFIFKNIRKKDLKNPDVAIPMAVRWLSRKKRLAEGKLGAAASAEEIILEYKGMLKSKSNLKDSALKKSRKEYDLLTKK